MKFILTLQVFILTCMYAYAQEYKPDSRMQILKDDDRNIYKSDNITKLDIIQALELNGNTINKYSLGAFDKKYRFFVIIDEFKDGKNIDSDTLINTTNEYLYWERGKENPFTSYLDQLKIFTKAEDTTFTLSVNTYKVVVTKMIHFEKYSDKSIYYIRSYVNAKWKLNDKVPLLVYASSWEDERSGSQRFCGAVNLYEDEKYTVELLSSTPHYYMVSYSVR